ncbi:MAG: P-loop NTPase [Myxococcota bacterium]
MTQLSFVVATEQSGLVELLEQSGRADVKAVVNEDGDLLSAVARCRPEAVLVDLGDEPGGMLDTLERIPAPRPVLLVYGPDDKDVMLNAMRLGARDYITPGTEAKDDLLVALERILRERGPEAGKSHLAPMLAVMGAKGGVGTTFVACQLAAGLAHRGARVAMMDGNLRLGDVALYFDLHPRYTITSLASAAEGLDAAYLHTVLASHRCGVQVLAAPERPEEADVIQASHIDHALSILRAENDWVVVDTPRDFDERSVHLLDQATSILVVTTCDVPALNHTRLQLDLLQRLGHSPHRVHVVVNRMDKNAPVQGKEIADFLDRKWDVRLPNDYPSASGCVNEGRPLWELAPKSALREAMDALTGATYGWCDRPLPEETERKGLFDRLRRKR